MSEDENNRAEKSCSGTSCKGSSCCSPHTTLLVAVMALLLAGYATFAATSKSGNGAIEARLAQIESQASETSGRIDALNKEVASNRDSLIQTKLRKALQDIQEAGDLAEAGTRAAITDAAKILQSLTASESPAAATTTPAAAPEEQPAQPATPDGGETPAATTAPAVEVPAESNAPSDTTPAAEPATHQAL